MRVHYAEPDKGFASYSIEHVIHVEFQHTTVVVWTTGFPFNLTLAELRTDGWYVLNMQGRYVGPVQLKLTEGQ